MPIPIIGVEPSIQFLLELYGTFFLPEYSSISSFLLLVISHAPTDAIGPPAVNRLIIPPIAPPANPPAGPAILIPNAAPTNGDPNPLTAPDSGLFIDPGKRSSAY